MNEISIGAVGAALIAGLVSLLGLIIGKEQKVSEFRQAWIDELRRDLVNYLVSINAISDALRLRKANAAIDSNVLASSYKSLNAASHGITLRVNGEELPAKSLLESMEKFEALAAKNADLTPANILIVEKQFISASKTLLKFEWNRVKEGERVFVLTKRALYVIIFCTIATLVFAWLSRPYGERSYEGEPSLQFVNTINLDQLTAQLPTA